MVDVIAGPGGHTANDTAPSNWNTVPVITVSTHKDADQNGDKLVKLPKLPAERYRYTVWHELRSNDLKGSDLHCPRVRQGPEIKEKAFRRVQDDQGNRIHHGKTGEARKLHERQMEDWENAVNVNLSYQELHHDYQKENFHRILKRLIRAEIVQIRDDNIVDLSSITFKCCTELNISKNYITSFKKLPKCPVLEVLNVSDNSINSFKSLSALKMTRVVWLDLRRNPICYEENYRQRVFQALPNLKVLDEVSRLPSDSADGLLPAGEGCIVM